MNLIAFERNADGRGDYRPLRLLGCLLFGEGQCVRGVADDVGMHDCASDDKRVEESLSIDGCLWLDHDNPQSEP